MPVDFSHYIRSVDVPSRGLEPLSIKVRDKPIQLCFSGICFLLLCCIFLPVILGSLLIVFSLFGPHLLLLARSINSLGFFTNVFHVRLGKNTALDKATHVILFVHHACIVLSNCHAWRTSPCLSQASKGPLVVIV